MRKIDPFPTPYQGHAPTHPLEWEAMARKIVREVLRIAPHERVILSANPYFGGAMLEAREHYVYMVEELQSQEMAEVSTARWKSFLRRGVDRNSNGRLLVSEG